MVSRFINKTIFFFLAKRQATFGNHLLTFQTDTVHALSCSETLDSTALAAISLFI